MLLEVVLYLFPTVWGNGIFQKIHKGYEWKYGEGIYKISGNFLSDDSLYNALSKLMIILENFENSHLHLMTGYKTYMEY